MGLCIIYIWEVDILERKSGVLMHISSLFGDYSIGSFGNEAKCFIDFLKDCGFTYWQVLPFCPTDNCNSPYKSPSAFAGNPFFIDLNCLYSKNLISLDELTSQKQSTPYTCEFERLQNERLLLLKKASQRVDNKNIIEQFVSSNPHLENFCMFMALKSANNDLIWADWKHNDFDESDLFMWKFIQYEFFSQWSEIKKYANSKGIKIIGDIPIYVDFDSSDVWANRHLFMLDSKNNPTAVAGVPPDFFSEDGQVWGNPLYNWDAMKLEDYKWWKDRIKYMSGIFDGIRIDHFRGIESFWAVPTNAENAKSGEMKKGPGLSLINAIHEVKGDSLIIAEDLGIITPDVAKLVSDSTFPGMRVFQFAFTGDSKSPHLPHNYINNCVAYSGTHDNNTLLGYLWELDPVTRKNMLEYCGFKGENWESGFENMIRTIMASHAGITIFPIQDLLRYGSDTRLNTPGRADGNWAYRITEPQLNSINKEHFKRLNELYSRV
jgi:4-alpha-glucanotransferase